MRKNFWAVLRSAAICLIRSFFLCSTWLIVMIVIMIMMIMMTMIKMIMIMMMVTSFRQSLFL